MKILLAALSLGLSASAALGATPSMEEMWAIIQQQQAEIAALKAQLASADSRIEETNVKVEATASAVEQGVSAGGQSLASSWTERTQIGNYGEMHYNNLTDQNDTGKDKDEIDFHRFVFYLGHEFSDTTRMFSEVELEHAIAGDDQNGEIELEQAYIEHDLNDSMRMKAGLFLIPVGILNLTHEPDTFYGVERNNVERNILPTTWWEGGVALSGEFAPGWSYDTAFTSGLKLDAEDGQWKIRDGRQKVSEADASDPAYTANLKFTGVAGLELGATIQYQQDIYQGKYQDDVDAMLYSAHVAYRNGPFGLRAVAASWDIDNAINTIQAGADRQEGWYIEPSWLLMRDFGVFARYSEWDNQAGGAGDTQFGQWDMGFNYWLEEHVVFKVDYQFQDAPDDQAELDGLNLGVGWSF
ncbi:MAG: porin [Halioglobus sp.]